MTKDNIQTQEAVRLLIEYLLQERPQMLLIIGQRNVENAEIQAIEEGQDVEPANRARVKITLNSSCLHSKISLDNPIPP